MTQKRPLEFWQEKAKLFSPIVYLYDDGEYEEQYLPAKIEYMLDRCDLRRWTHEDPLSGWHSELAKQGPLRPADVVAHDNQDMFLQPTRSYQSGDVKDAPFYYRVAPTFGGIQFQYWFFYTYNGAPAWWSPAPWTDHQGDWENVRVDVNEALDKVLRVGYSAHDGSKWVDKFVHSGEPSEGVGRLQDQTHPWAFSAYQTHANYPSAGNQVRDDRPDDSTAKGPVWTGALKLVSVDPALLDRPRPDETWVHWKGRWGATRWRLPEAARSPESPGEQSDWRAAQARPGDWQKDWTGVGSINPARVPALDSRGLEQGGILFLGNRDLSNEYTPTVLRRLRELVFTGLPPKGYYERPRYTRSRPLPERIRLAFVSDFSGRLLFAVEYETDSGTAWTRWQPVTSKYAISSYAVISSPDGRLHLFATSRANGSGVAQLVHFSEVSEPSVWQEDDPIVAGRLLERCLALARPNAQGRLAVIYSNDGKLAIAEQEAEPAKWKLTECPLTYPLSERRMEAAVVNRVGSIELLAANDDGVVFRSIHQPDVEGDCFTPWKPASPPHTCDVELRADVTPSGTPVAFAATGGYDLRVKLLTEALAPDQPWDMLKSATGYPFAATRLRTGQFEVVVAEQKGDAAHFATRTQVAAWD